MMSGDNTPASLHTLSSAYALQSCMRQASKLKMGLWPRCCCIQHQLARCFDRETTAHHRQQAPRGTRGRRQLGRAHAQNKNSEMLDRASCCVCSIEISEHMHADEDEERSARSHDRQQSNSTLALCRLCNLVGNQQCVAAGSREQELRLSLQRCCMCWLSRRCRPRGG